MFVTSVLNWQYFDCYNSICFLTKFQASILGLGQRSVAQLEGNWFLMFWLGPWIDSAIKCHMMITKQTTFTAQFTCVRVHLLSDVNVSSSWCDQVPLHRQLSELGIIWLWCQLPVSSWSVAYPSALSWHSRLSFIVHLGSGICLPQFSRDSFCLSTHYAFSL
jgi:hypothetical protein